MTSLIDLPDYTVTQKTYDGSETVLYRGKRDSDGAPVAIKLTRSEFPTARELGRLRREFGILKDVAHLPGVGKGYALEKLGRGLALVMEDLGDTSLHRALKTARLDVATILRVAISIAGTLEALHRLRVIHKDIKPHNIMVGPGLSSPRVIDFGISARLSQETQKAASPTALEGTLAYMSPEQTGRMNRPVDRRTDLYSLGVTLYEMLTGVLPFPATDTTELLHSHLARTPTPPHDRAPGVPKGLSDVVMKLLAKIPEDRYQTARGLEADLTACLSQWTETGQIAPFPLGRRDIADELDIPQKLYGRDHEIEALLTAFDRARRGPGELVLVAGYSGVGKSALVSEIHKPIAQRGGHFVRGKFDEVSRSVPLAPVAHAFRELIRQILAEPPGGLEVWKAKLVEATGGNGRLLFDLIPELELVIGPQPEVPAVAPTEAQNRFALLVQRFVRVFATADHPLAIFLDDLQWADPASLKLLNVLLGDPDTKHLFVLGAYRDNEIDADHPLLSLKADLRKAGTAITELGLAPLDLGTTSQLVAETLRVRPRDVADLAAIVFDKTGGNPFFIGQFLGALHEQRLISLDAETGAFTWETEKIRSATVTDNVAELMIGRLARLSPEARRALLLASCIGHEFDLGVLSTIAERSPAETARDLWEPLREGLVVPLDSDYRLLDESADTGEGATDLRVSYQFLHDRVREAAYSLIEEDRRAETHLSIGRLLWAESGKVPREEDLLEIVRHLNLGIRGVTDPAEREQIAALDLRAAQRAKASTAYQAAKSLFDAGAELLGEEGWDRAYDLSFSLHLDGAECTYLNGEIDQADARFDAILPRAKTDLERARIQSLRAILYTTVGKFADALRVGLVGLALVGVTLPTTPEEAQAAFGAKMGEVAENLGGRRIEDLIDAPRMDDPARQMALQLLCDLAIPIYYVNPTLYGAAVLTQVNISLRYGHSDVSAFSYMAYGFMLAAMLGQPAQGLAFGELSLALNDRIHNASLTPKLTGIFSNYRYLQRPLRQSMPYYERSRETAIEVGDLVYLVASWFGQFPAKLGAGYQLEELREDAEKGIAVAQRAKNVTGTAVMTVARQTVTNLTGKSLRRDTLSSEGFDEESFLAGLEEKKDELGAALFYLRAFKVQLAYLYGDVATAAREAELAERESVAAFGLYYVTRVSFYACLALLALPAPDAPEEAKKRAEEIARHKAKIAGLAASCPDNYQHKILLIEAEEARVKGETTRAGELYDQAIAAAEAHDFPHDEALANELAAKMYAAIGKVRLARGHMGDAYLGYKHWGATAKTEDLARLHPDLLPLLAVGRRGTSVSSTNTAGTTLLTGTTIGGLREAALVVKATQAIAGEVKLPKVIERLLRIVIENAGAQHGALLISRDERLSIEATFSSSPEVIQVGPSVPFDTRDDIAAGVVLFVARTREVVVIDDAREAGRFTADPRIASGKARSILCLPLTHQGRLGGLLYLEHSDASGAFTATRVELLELFASQAAIAIENALLLADVQLANDEVRRVNDEVRRVNERLEAEVQERTEELVSKNRELGEANERLHVELTQREQAERERAMFQEKMIEAQRSRLMEMSTPLIPITDRIMVMPLIGSVDAERAAQVLEVALEGAQRHRASVVILDITGMKHIDTQVVSSLLSTGSALRLLGAQAVLTGIRPEVAQAMVALGADLSGIVTKGTLQSGIAYALERSGERGPLNGRTQRGSNRQ